ncbi:hypothetical protein Hanom_Chr02g00163871 [Helianthus anomalus]
MGRHVRAVCPLASHSAGEHRNARRYGPKKKIRRDVGSGVMCGLFEFFFFLVFPLIYLENNYKKLEINN